MEGNESGAIFNSLNLNPQLFINAALNIVDELIDTAFDLLHQEASNQLQIDDAYRAQELNKGLDYTRCTIQSVLDKRLSVWEKYSFLRIFVVPEGFSLSKDDEASAGNIMDVDAVDNPDLDKQLDTLRTKLTSAEQESVELKREIEALERQSVICNHQGTSFNELMNLSEQIFEDGVFKGIMFIFGEGTLCRDDNGTELKDLATELCIKVEKLKTERADDIQHVRLERWHLQNGDLLRMLGGNGTSMANYQLMPSYNGFHELDS